MGGFLPEAGRHWSEEPHRMNAADDMLRADPLLANGDLASGSLNRRMFAAIHGRGLLLVSSQCLPNATARRNSTVAVSTSFRQG